MKALVHAMTALLLAGAALAPAAAGAAPAEKAEKATRPAKTALPTDIKLFKGDFDAMLKRRLIRVAVPYSRTLFFNDRGQQRGLTAMALGEFEQWLNRKYKTGTHRIVVLAQPVTRDRLLPMLQEGKTDIAAGNLTITPERSAQADFSAPLADNVSEVVVTGPASPPLSKLEDLAGKEVHVRPSSSYHQSLKRLNERLRKEGRPMVALRLVPDALEDEDMMDMMNAGMLGIIVVDDWKARMWASLLPGLKVNESLKLSEGGRIAWAFRRNSPQLATVVNEFLAYQRKTMGSVAQRLPGLEKYLKALGKPTADADWQRFEQSLQHFKTYGERYSFDYLMMAAQGYQESRLNQAAKSPVGAVGIMQLMPATGAEMKVGDIHQAEPNVHAGIKYMRQLIDTYFDDADFDEVNRTLFAFAAYNAGPNRISRLRKEAEREGLDPDQWFNNVELIAAKRVGQETVGYVRNIFKYYVAYKLQLETLATRRSLLQQGGMPGMK